MDLREKHILDTFKVLLVKRIKLHYLVLFGSRARGMLIRIPIWMCLWLWMS
jgi:hypothetical protein